MKIEKKLEIDLNDNSLFWYRGYVVNREPNNGHLKTEYFEQWTFCVNYCDAKPECM